MVSTVSRRPNHYEVLGIAPTATSDQIVEAFARELHRPRAFGGLALVGLAYETLRSPEKRKAYDRSIGLSPDPEPDQWMVAPRWRGRRVPSPVPTLFVARPAADEPAAAAPSARTEPEPEARMAPFIAGSLRKPPECDMGPSPDPDADIAGPPPVDPAPELFLPAAEPESIGGKRIGIAAGGLVASVCLLGAWAGWEASNDVVPQQVDEQAMTLSLPPADPPKTASASPRALQPRTEVAAERPARAAVVVAPPPKRAFPRPVELTAAEEQALAGNQFVDSVAEQVQTAEATAEPTVTEGEPTQPVAASMPLSGRTIARTIQRIGYACGQVASTVPIEGASPGVFKVTCTSGHSYRAQPVRGRYRFKRLGGR